MPLPFVKDCPWKRFDCVDPKDHDHHNHLKINNKHGVQLVNPLRLRLPNCQYIQDVFMVDHKVDLKVVWYRLEMLERICNNINRL